MNAAEILLKTECKGIYTALKQTKSGFTHDETEIRVPVAKGRFGNSA